MIDSDELDELLLGPQEAMLLSYNTVQKHRLPEDDGSVVLRIPGREVVCSHRVQNREPGKLLISTPRGLPGPSRLIQVHAYPNTTTQHTWSEEFYDGNITDASECPGTN